MLGNSHNPLGRSFKQLLELDLRKTEDDEYNLQHGLHSGPKTSAVFRPSSVHDIEKATLVDLTGGVRGSMFRYFSDNVNNPASGILILHAVDPRFRLFL